MDFLKKEAAEDGGRWRKVPEAENVAIHKIHMFLMFCLAEDGGRWRKMAEDEIVLIFPIWRKMAEDGGR